MMTTRRHPKVLSLLLALLLAVFGHLSPAYAALGQLYLISSTTLNGAISSTATTLVLTSASASTGSSFGAPAVGQCLYIDTEMMRITAVSSTTMTVQRGTTAKGPHATLAVILTAPCSAFRVGPPPNIGGNQDCTLQPAPWVDINSGDSWWCDQVLNSWSVTNPATRNGTAGSRRVAQ